MKLFDSHCHLQMEQFGEDRSEVYGRAREKGVRRMMIVGTDLATSRSAREFARDHRGCYPTAGLHPHDADNIFEQGDALRNLLRSPDVVAVGETGLDFFKEYSPKTQQKESLNVQLNWAKEEELPLVFHCRDADDELIEILQQNMNMFEDVLPSGRRGVVHCFSGTPEHLEAYQEMGFHVSFSGIVTYPGSDPLREAAAQADPDLLLVETDAPFLAPQTNRGKRNEPSFMVETAKVVADRQGMSLEDLAAVTRENTEQLFLSGTRYSGGDEHE